MDGDLRLLTIVGIVGDIHETASTCHRPTGLCEFVPTAAPGDHLNDAE